MARYHSTAHPGECRDPDRKAQLVAFYVYIVANRRNGAIYVGMTDDLANRVYQHKTKQFAGFTARYGCDRLVWYEVHDTRESAFLHERRIKEWRRSWKLLRSKRQTRPGPISTKRSTAEDRAL